VLGGVAVAGGRANGDSLLDDGQIFAGEDEIDGAERLGQLLEGACSDRGDDVSASRGDPCGRELRNRHADAEGARARLSAGSALVVIA